jgi:D-alanyl-D-alanine carboxypeptidase/D-alanyl-D-alanine-endopeptidase (penicillin-binding protein 4)
VLAPGAIALAAAALIGHGPSTAIAAEPLPLLAAIAPAPAPTPAPPVDTSLGGLIDALLEDPVFADAQIGISIFDLHKKRQVYARGDDLPLNPASNVKLATTAAALRVLGPEHRYPTQLLRADGALRGAVVEGDVWLRGSGDPQLTTENLYALAGQLRAQGIRRVTGGIIVDNSRFDRDGLPPGFDQKNELAAYRAPSGAVSVNHNLFVVRTAPGANAGDAGLAAVDPPVPGIVFTNSTKTVPGAARKLYADLKYEKGHIELEMKGEIGVDASAGRYEYPIDDPSRHAGEVLAFVFRERGIKLGRSRIKIGKPPDDARLLATHFSPPLSMLIRPINKFSNNFMAEQVLKTLAPRSEPATFAAGLAAVKKALRELGVDLTGARVGNGSGLYDTNRYTPSQVTTLLRKMYGDFRYRAEFVSSLSVMGIDGTTRSRLQDSSAERWIRVKTGTLDGVSALSGYVGAPGREPIVFSLLFNDLPRGGTSRARDVQNEIAQLIARYAAGKPLVLPTPTPTPVPTQ